MSLNGIKPSPLRFPERPAPCTRSVTETAAQAVFAGERGGFASNHCPRRWRLIPRVSFYAMVTYFISSWEDLAWGQVRLSGPGDRAGTSMPGGDSGSGGDWTQAPTLSQGLLPTPGAARAGGVLALWSRLQTLGVVNTSIPPTPPPSLPHLLCSFFQSTSIYGGKYFKRLEHLPCGSLTLLLSFSKLATG